MFASQVDIYVHFPTYFPVEIPVPLVCFAFICTVSKRRRTIGGCSHAGVVTHEHNAFIEKFKIFRIVKFIKIEKKKSKLFSRHKQRCAIVTVSGKKRDMPSMPCARIGGTACREHKRTLLIGTWTSIFTVARLTKPHHPSQ